jgi:GNAT superfamily N-acetyltransferase
MEVTFIHHNNWWWGESFGYVIDSGACLGRGSILKEKPDELFIDGLSTQQDRRGNGLATFCLHELEELARTKGLNTIVLWVDIDKPDNLSFYVKRGFVERMRDDTIIEMVKEIRYGTTD